MSFEGYYQWFCGNGHFHTTAVDYSQSEMTFALCVCGASPMRWNIVDDTNCEGVGVIPPFELAKLKVADAILYTCKDPECQHVTEREPARYRLPTDIEMDKYRGYSTLPDGLFSHGNDVFDSNGNLVQVESSQEQGGAGALVNTVD